MLLHLEEGPRQLVFSLTFRCLVARLDGQQLLPRRLSQADSLGRIDLLPLRRGWVESSSRGADRLPPRLPEQPPPSHL